ncbi:MAG: pseudouridine synthase [Symbiobacterium sp.]|uniref:pseudouridine synthase n=1 Tax=Symbiobacterium sp. TaxID=1971213 RepID=UPI003464A4A8
MADQPRKSARPRGPAKGPAKGPARARFGAGGSGGFTSVDEQLRASLERGRFRRRHAGPSARPARKTGGRKEPATGAFSLTPAEAEVAERLQKVMARAGVASRRHSEELIRAGRVTVNGRVVTELGTKVVPGRDVIEVDGRPLGAPEEKVYVLVNKPKGYVTTLFDPQGRPKVIDLLDDQVAERVYPVGRLDYDTEGLVLLTNDGDLANALMHPAKQVKKTYIAKVRGVPGPGKIKQLQHGVELDDGPTAPAEVRVLEVRAPNSATLLIRIHEGRNRQVRRMCAAVGHEVIHLRRTALGPLQLGDLPVGEWRYLTDAEVKALYHAARLRPGGKPPAAKGARKRR